MAFSVWSSLLIPKSIIEGAIPNSNPPPLVKAVATIVDCTQSGDRFTRQPTESNELNRVIAGHADAPAPSRRA